MSILKESNDDLKEIKQPTPVPEVQPEPTIEPEKVETFNIGDILGDTQIKNIYEESTEGPETVENNEVVDMFNRNTETPQEAPEKAEGVSEKVLRTQGKGLLKFGDILNSRLAGALSKENHQKYKLQNDEIEELNDLLVEYLKISNWEPSPGWTFAITAIVIFGLKQVEALENKKKNAIRATIHQKKKEAEEKNTAAAQKEFLKVVRENPDTEEAAIVRNQFKVIGKGRNAKYAYTADGNTYLKKSEQTQKPPIDLYEQVIEPGLKEGLKQADINKKCIEFLKAKKTPGYE